MIDLVSLGKCFTCSAAQGDNVQGATQQVTPLVEMPGPQE